MFYADLNVQVKGLSGLFCGVAVTTLQPFVHDLITTIAGCSATVSPPDGQIHGLGAQGVYVADERVLSRFVVGWQAGAPEAVHHRHEPDSLTVTSVLRDGSEPTPDPTLRLRRRRHQLPDGMAERWTVVNDGLVPRPVSLQLSVDAEFASTFDVKCGRTVTRPVETRRVAGGTELRTGRSSVAVRSSPAPTAVSDDGTLRWDLHVGAHAEASVDVTVTATLADGLFAAPRRFGSPAVRSTTSDRRLDELLRWGLADIAHLTCVDPLAPPDRFVAAGSPWYLTLFGRDSLWTARMMIPFDLDLAASTLRCLARRQGTDHVAGTAEQPGRILHEERSRPVDLGDTTLPARYFGSIDATMLWISTLADAWRWGLGRDAVTELLPALRAAAGWLTTDSDPDGDGLVEYIDESGHGLANQGWKDSGDSVSWRDGTMATPPIALCEVQGYAYAAALDAADLFDAFELPGSTELRAYAARVRHAVSRSFWFEDRAGRFVAIAVDRSKRPLDVVTSNPGHLLGTGILRPAEEQVVVSRLMAELATPAGMRTMSASSARFNPISYHNGSIWPHDVAICARGMTLAGFAGEAAELLRGLLRATETFGGRLPELYGYTDDDGVIPYPASCRPQAWSAAAAAVAAWACAPVVPTDHGPTLLAPAPVVEHAVIDAIVCQGRRIRTELHHGSASMTDT